MPCYKPLKAYKSFEHKTEAGKCQIFFNSKDAGFSAPIDLPCGQCIGCRLDRSRGWALRCVHEASLYDNNCFLTLTFNDENINSHRSLVKSDFQKFMKRLRKKYKGSQVVVDSLGKRSRPIRFFHCGEYGSQLQRPHHHACLFNFDFDDKVLWSVRDEVRLYRSASLEKLWPFGFCTIGDVTWDSAAYVARYITKKITGDAAAVHYADVDIETGEMSYIEPEYITMSRRPGIGKGWFDAFMDDIYPKDFITHNGKPLKVPRFYDKIYDSIAPESLLDIRRKRLIRASEHADNNTAKRLRTRSTCQELKAKQLVRSFENGS